MELQTVLQALQSIALPTEHPVYGSAIDGAIASFSRAKMRRYREYDERRDRTSAGKAHSVSNRTR